MILPNLTEVIKKNMREKLEITSKITNNRQKQQSHLKCDQLVLLDPIFFLTLIKYVIT